MAKVQYNSRSPYANTPQTSWYLRRLEFRDIPPDGTDFEIEVGNEHDERPDLLSYDLYDTVDFWWIFIVRNMDKLEDPIFDLKPGMKLMVPTLNRLQRLI